MEADIRRLKGGQFKEGKYRDFGIAHSSSGCATTISTSFAVRSGYGRNAVFVASSIH
jgi:hypothetical protein